MTNPGHDDLLAWRASKPTNYYTPCRPCVRASIAHGVTIRQLSCNELSSFGEVVATEIEPAVQAIERNVSSPNSVPTTNSATISSTSSSTPLMTTQRVRRGVGHARNVTQL